MLHHASQPQTAQYTGETRVETRAGKGMTPDATCEGPAAYPRRGTIAIGAKV
jgi:hypothetical protein